MDAELLRLRRPRSVRQLTNSTGAVTDTYDYDAFGNLINSTGSTPNNYLFAGEQFDPALGLYYNRARYLNTATGRFWSMDSYEGNDDDPRSLHQYLYTENNPVDNTDKDGNQIDDVAAASIDIPLPNFNTIVNAGPLLKIQFENAFTVASKAHAAAIGWLPGGSRGNILDSLCRLASVVKPLDCERGCLAWQDWMYNWVENAIQIHKPNWNNVSPQREYLLEYYIFVHHILSVSFNTTGLTPVVLDPWRNPSNPVWEESTYIQAFGSFTDEKNGD